MYNTILLDLDNTILDFDAAEKDSIRRVIEGMGLVYSEELLREYRRINGELWRKLERQEIEREFVLNARFHEFFKQHHIFVDGEETEKLFRTFLDESSALVPNAEYTLSMLKSHGKRVFSASNGVYSTQLKRLKNAGVIELFDGHFISEKIGYEKPSFKFFDYCKENIPEFEMSSTIMVGDSIISDIKGAIGAGIDACFYRHNHHENCEYAKYNIADIAELVDIVDRVKKP